LDEEQNKDNAKKSSQKHIKQENENIDLDKKLKKDFKSNVSDDESSTKRSEKIASEKQEKKDEKSKTKKSDTSKEKPRKKVDRGPDFKYIIRLSNSDINGEKSFIYGLTSVKGIGLHMATFIAEKTGFDKNKKIGDLTDQQIEKIQEAINSIKENAPYWMLNHRKEYDTGNNIHLVGTEIDTRLRDEINIMKKIRSYRGIRHERGLKVRGQRTGSNGRKGLALGVSKRKELPKQGATESK
jgi:small subunit ribosomal protein S13